jgi:hypothetical protein
VVLPKGEPVDGGFRFGLPGGKEGERWPPASRSKTAGALPKTRPRTVWHYRYLAAEELNTDNGRQTPAVEPTGHAQPLFSTHTNPRRPIFGLGLTRRRCQPEKGSRGGMKAQ